MSTDISTDGKVNELSDRAALLYTWALPHFADDCRLTPKNAAEVKLAVVPGREWTVGEVDSYMEEIFLKGLWGKDEKGAIFIPSESFYKYQTYINAAKRRKTPQIAASPSPSPSPKEEKNKTPLVVAFVVPDWINIETWKSFEEMRRKERHPLTDRAKELVVRQLEKFRDLGHDPNECLEISVRNGWRDVYEPNGRRQSKVEELRQRTKEALEVDLESRSFQSGLGHVIKRLPK